MAAVLEDITCPGCGAPTAMSAATCEYCGRPVVISTFSSIRHWQGPEVATYARAYEDVLRSGVNPDVKLALGICLIRLGQCGRALEQISEAIAFNLDQSEAFFYSAVARLDGKRPALGSMAAMKSALADLDSALMLERRGSYCYLSGMIRADFFERKHLRVAPTATEMWHHAVAAGISQDDMATVHDLVRFSLS